MRLPRALAIAKRRLPWYVGLMTMADPRARRCHVFVDGHHVRDCVAADDREGWALELVRDANGRCVIDQDRGIVLRRILTGRVEIRIA